MNIVDGLLSAAIQINSENCDDRPDSNDIQLLVIHGISLPPGEFGGGYIEQLFTNNLNPGQHPYFEEIKDLKVSAHLLISRDGIITQFVPFYKRAWHAGESCYKDRQCCNDFSIGIELEGTDQQPYADVQYEMLNKIISQLQKSYPALRKDNIVGHCHIAAPRKTDPGPAFDWSRVDKTA